ncbi:hypothetical protein BDF14DRAFT_1878201 [Spinellus fusiger]|nr:hypothetical protein BDF14DRAFT_1878201 [Spinellus fusiger]
MNSKSKEIAATTDATAIQHQLDTLASLRKKTQFLVDSKANLSLQTEALNIKQGLLEEATSQRQRLQKEKKVLLEMIQSVQRDIETVVKMEEVLVKERDELKQTVTRIRDQEYEPLHEQVNELRARNGLQRLPSVEQEIEAQMAKQLENRRKEWQESPTSHSELPQERQGRRWRAW